MRTILLTLLLTACGSENLTSVSRTYKYSVGCVENIYSAIPLDSHDLTFKFELAIQTMSKIHGLETPKSWCANMAGVQVVILDNYYYATDLVGNVRACAETDLGTDACKWGEHHLIENTIYTNQHLGSLVHEYIHAHDLLYLAIGTGWHEGWDTNGNSEMANAYMYAVTPALPRAEPPESVHTASPVN